MHYFTLHYITLHYITSHHITLHSLKFSQPQSVLWSLCLDLNVEDLCELLLAGPAVFRTFLLWRWLTAVSAPSPIVEGRVNSLGPTLEPYREVDA